MFDNLNMNNINDMLGDFQKKAEDMQLENESKKFTAKSGGGMVSVTMNGLNEVVDIEIDDSLLEDKESLQILLISATNDTLKMVEDDRKNSALKMMGGMNMFGAGESKN